MFLSVCFFRVCECVWVSPVVGELEVEALVALEVTRDMDEPMSPKVEGNMKNHVQAVRTRKKERKRILEEMSVEQMSEDDFIKNLTEQKKHRFWFALQLKQKPSWSKQKEPGC